MPPEAPPFERVATPGALDRRGAQALQMFRFGRTDSRPRVHRGEQLRAKFLRRPLGPMQTCQDLAAEELLDHFRVYRCHRQKLPSCSLPRVTLRRREHDPARRWMLRRRVTAPVVRGLRMKLTARLVSLLLLGALVLLVIDTYSSIRREVSIVERDMRLSAGLMGRAMRGILVEVWSTRGESRSLGLIQDVNKAEQSAFLRWVWLHAPPDDPQRPLVPRERLEPVFRGEGGSNRDLPLRSSNG